MPETPAKPLGFCHAVSSITTLHHLERKLKRITEPELRQACATKTLKSAEIVDTEGGYILIVEVAWKPGEHTLFTQRNRVRTWSSLNSVVDFIVRHQYDQPRISIRLRPQTNTKD